MGKRRNRGMYIISALLVSVVIALFIGAGLRLSIGNLKAGNSLDHQAMFAAESGLRYVQTRLAADYAWEADENLVISSTDLVVHEDNGNIIGIVRSPDGQWSQFRVRFNYQDDGEGDADGRADPNSAYVIDSQYVSVKNLLGGSPVPVPRADGTGYSVTATSPTPYDVPAGTACVIVEGRAGPGLRDLSDFNLNPTPTGAVNTRVVEAYLVAANTPGADAAAQSAGDMLFDLTGNSKVSLSAKDKNQASRLRSRSTIEVRDGAATNLVADNGETYTLDGSLNANADSSVNPLREDLSTGFYRLEWGDVKQADPAGDSIQGGTYVIWDDGTLHYYDMAYNDYVTFIEANPSAGGTLMDTTSLPAGFEFDGSDSSKPKITISGDIHVAGTAVTDELNIIPRAGAQEDPPDSTSGTGPGLTESEMVTTVLTSLPPTPSAQGTGSGVSSGPQAARWDNIPISGTVPGGEIRAETGSWSSGTWRGVVLKETSPGVASLTVDAGFRSNLFTPAISSDPLGALTNGMTSQFAGTPQLQQILSVMLGGGGSAGPDMKELELPTVPANLRADNVKIEFKPEKGQSAILSAQGTVRLGANLKGEGGSITSGGTIRVVGNGTELSASLEDGLTLYAKEDVVMSSLKEKPVGSNNWEYKDLKLKGVVYAWGNIEAKINNDDPSVKKAGKFELEGTMVAYGGDPAGNPGAGAGGAISILAGDVKLKYNPAYLLQLDTTPPPGPLTQSLYTTY